MPAFYAYSNRSKMLSVTRVRVDRVVRRLKDPAVFLKPLLPRR